MNVAVTAPATLKIGMMAEGALLVVGESGRRWWQFWRKRPAVAILTESDLIWVYQVISKIMKQRATKETPLTQQEEFADDLRRAMVTIEQEGIVINPWRLAELLSAKGYVKL